MTTEEARKYLEGKGWPAIAANAILHAADQKRQVVPTARWDLYKDFASSNDRNHRYLSTALGFITWELTNPFEPIGRHLRAATTEEKAREIVAPYFNMREQQ